MMVVSPGESGVRTIFVSYRLANGYARLLIRIVHTHSLRDLDAEPFLGLVGDIVGGIVGGIAYKIPKCKMQDAPKKRENK